MRNFSLTPVLFVCYLCFLVSWFSFRFICSADPSIYVSLQTSSGHVSPFFVVHKFERTGVWVFSVDEETTSANTVRLFTLCVYRGSGITTK